VSYTRAQLRTQIQRLGDFSGSARWDATAGGEIDQMAGYVFGREWGRLLNANRHYRTNKVQPISDANGRIPVSAFSTGTGDSAKNFYRILTFVRNNYQYKMGTVEEWALGEGTGVAPRVYVYEGQTVLFLPKETNFDFSTDPKGSFIWVNWRPARVDQLSGDGVSVDFPDGYEQLLALETAAMLLTKGGAEVDTTAQFRVLAEQMRADMLQDVARSTAKAQRFQFEDTAAMWAGN
jgi:hypothetical protein